MDEMSAELRRGAPRAAIGKRPSGHRNQRDFGRGGGDAERRKWVNHENLWWHETTVAVFARFAKRSTRFVCRPTPVTCA
jgi:hypothetical protein